MQVKFIKKFALQQNFRIFGCWQKCYSKPQKFDLKKYKSMKISKSKVITFIAIGIIISLQFFFFAPFLKQIYFYDDVRNFEKNSWKYSFVLSSLIIIFMIVYAIKKKLLSRRNFFTRRLSNIFLFFYGAFHYWALLILCHRSQKIWLILAENFDDFFYVSISPKHLLVVALALALVSCPNNLGQSLEHLLNSSIVLHNHITSLGI